MMQKYFNFNSQLNSITNLQWLFIVAMVFVGFFSLTIPVPFFKSSYGQLIPAILFVAIPLGAFIKVSPEHWTEIFKKIGVKDIFLMFGFALLNLIVSISVGIVVVKLFGANSNPAIAGVTSLDDFEKILFFLKTIPQLFGEELFTILIFLAVLSFASSTLKYSRKKAVIMAWLLSSFAFSLIHLPTYDWNFLQCVLVIGTARVFLTLPYVITKNIWVSTGTHIINDWVIVSITILGAGLK
ncbi:MAG: CPBP family intramembrane glutamic endopeptidase [Campylobacterota bacterium]|nr:CPBP family intramembrane glutamic endopeptidase [Campylobacterota bacterium]